MKLYGVRSSFLTDFDFSKQAYRNPELDIHYWRTSTGYEVDFILNEMEIAIDVKSSSRIHDKYLRGLRALLEEQKVRRAIIVSLENKTRKIDSSIEIMPWHVFLEKLWSGNLKL